MSIEAEYTNKDALSANETTESPEWKRRSRILYIDFNEFEKATTVNPDEVLVIKTTPEYAQYLTQRLKDELNTGKPVVVMLAKDMDSYVVKKDSLKISTRNNTGDDFISKAELKEWVENWYRSYSGYHPLDNSNSIPITQLYELLDNIPSVKAKPLKPDDVQVVRHGKWKQKLDPYEFFETIPVCSECGCTTKMRDTPPHCPHCGAIMDL